MTDETTTSNYGAVFRLGLNIDTNLDLEATYSVMHPNILDWAFGKLGANMMKHPMLLLHWP